MTAHEKIVQFTADKCAELGIEPEKAKAIVDALAEHMGEEEAMEAEDMRKAEEADAELAGMPNENRDLLAKMSAELAEMKAALAATSADARVTVDTIGRNVSAAQRATLCKLAATDEAGYVAMLSAFTTSAPVSTPPAARTQTPALRTGTLPTVRPAAAGPAHKPQPLTGAAFLSASESEQDEAISAIMSAEKCDYLTAANWCSTGVKPLRLVGLQASGLA